MSKKNHYFQNTTRKIIIIFRELFMKIINFILCLIFFISSYLHFLTNVNFLVNIYFQLFSKWIQVPFFKSEKFVLEVIIALVCSNWYTVEPDTERRHTERIVYWATSVSCERLRTERIFCFLWYALTKIVIHEQLKSYLFIQIVHYNSYMNNWYVLFTFS